MFSKELEDLIKATIEDGVLEEYEKAALVKRAQAEGVDLAELEIYINSLLQKRKKEENQVKHAEQAAIEQKKKEAMGRTCPSCGKQVPPMTLKCECGYEFTSQKQVSSVQILFDKIQAIREVPIKTSFFSVLLSNMFLFNRTPSESEKRDKQIQELISMFPVPNTKEDIIEFCAMAIPNSKLKGGIWGSKSGRCIVLCGVLIVLLIIGLFTGYEDIGWIMLIIAMYGLIAIFMINDEILKWNKMANVWRGKFEQVIIKGRSMRGDAEFIQQLNYYEQLFRQKKSNNTLKF